MLIPPKILLVVLSHDLTHFVSELQHSVHEEDNSKHFNSGSVKSTMGLHDEEQVFKKYRNLGVELVGQGVKFKKNCKLIYLILQR